MEKKSNMVQTVMLVIFGLGILIGVLFFSGKIKLGSDAEETVGPTGNILIWGVLPYGQVNSLILPIEQANPGLKLTYVEKKPEKIQSELVNALSSGKGPDLFMMAPGGVAQNIDRLYMLPFTSTPQSTYKSTFADIAADYMTDKGIIAAPLFIEPMVMYYNRDIFATNFEVDPPKTWTEVENLAKLMTVRNDAGVVSQSAVAFGTTNNVSYFKDMIMLRVLQKGNPIIKFVQGRWDAALSDDTDLYETMGWYTQFANAKSEVYSWNPSLLNDRDAFTSGKLAMYFGYPNELETIRKKNPNLNFAMAMIPQESATARKTNYARVYTIGISKISKNIAGAASVVGILSSKDTLSQLLVGTYYAPARRDMLMDKPKDNAEMTLVYNSAIISKSFLDPDADATKQILVTNITRILSGASPVDAVAQSIASGFRDLAGKLPIPETK